MLFIFRSAPRLVVMPLLFIIFIFIVGARAQADTTPAARLAPIPAQFDFEQEQLDPVWSTTAAGATIAITHEAANVRSGRGALELSWTPVPGRLVFLTAEPVCIQSRARSLTLSIKVAGPTPVNYGVREADGTTYQGYLYSPGGVWHDLAVDLDELMLSEGTPDENGRLDVGQITGIFVGDLSNLPGEAGRSLGIKEGEQRLWLDNFALSDRLAPHRSHRGEDGTLIIDDFEREPILALPIGGPELTLVAGPGNDDTSALRVGYDRKGYRWVGFVAALGYLDLTKYTGINLRVRAECPAPLTVVLEEWDGTKYSVRRNLDPAQGWHDLRLAFEQFKLDRSTTDENDRLDLNQLRVLIPVLDTARAQIGEDEQGAWEVSRITAIND